MTASPAAIETIMLPDWPDLRHRPAHSDAYQAAEHNLADLVQPVLDAIGVTRRVGGYGNGYVAKLVNNQLWFIHAAAIGEAMVAATPVSSSGWAKTPNRSTFNRAAPDSLARLAV